MPELLETLELMAVETEAVEAVEIMVPVEMEETGQ